MNHITAGGILVYTIHNNEILLLLGKEKLTGYSAFSGFIEKNESVINGVYREFFEESMNMIELYTNNLYTMPYYIDNTHNFIMYLMKVDYDKYKDLPFYFNRTIHYMKDFKNIPEGYIEKINIDWINYKDIKNKKSIFRKDFLTIMNNIKLDQYV